MSERLLTDEEIKQACRNAYVWYPVVSTAHRNIAEAQRDLTASIKDAECQERVERIFREMEACMGEDITEYRDGHVSYLTIPADTWQALRKKEGVDGRA